ncbi:hypothetical protein N7456_000789 [Penicillium angulare]|uniref:Uncharacterized protein n=1 Tax=Penicillium angulare TaxID=116970 RepID=A0A9W9GCT3_9EURO|nr:hypothetical protein N7456_000789 [Penicillium angulare]
MSAFNPFRRNLDGGAVTATATPPTSVSAAQSTNTSSSNLASNLTSNPPQPQALPSQLPDDYPRKSSLSLEIQEDDSTSSDEQTADPFNPDSSVSDNEDDRKPQNFKSSAPGDHPRASFGSTPHPAPSTDGSTTSPSEAPLATNEYYKQSTSSLTESSSDEDTSSAVNRSVGDPQHYKQSARLSSYGNKDKKPPPPPKSHHGKRINTASSTTTTGSAQSLPARPTHRSSFHSSSPESFTSSHKASTPNASSAQRLAPDYFAYQSENQAAVASNGSLSRSDSQHKRPPTPPLSRRHSQMHRSKSSQSKSSASRLTLSSVDSESNDGSQPPSPGPSTRSVASSLSRDRKRVSMPPPSSGDFHPTVISPAGTSDHLSPPNSSQTSLPGRRASSYGNLATGSSFVAPPPPPPPRRARDSSARSHEGRPVSQMITTQEEPLPQPSNAIDILADLSRLQKEVDDLRGHYESRKVSE